MTAMWLSENQVGGVQIRRIDSRRLYGNLVYDAKLKSNIQPIKIKNDESLRIKYMEVVEGLKQSVFIM